MKRLFAVSAKTDPLKDNCESVLEKILVGISMADIIISPEYSFSSPSFITECKKEEILQRLRKHVRGKLILAPFLWKKSGNLYNSCSIVSEKGEQDYFKETTDTEENLAQNQCLEYVKGNNQLPFYWENQIIGLEICRDHGMGRLKRNLHLSQRYDVPLQMVLSRGASYVPSNDVTSRGGYFVLCDGSPSIEVRQGSVFVNPMKVIKDGELYQLNL